MTKRPDRRDLLMLLGGGVASLSTFPALASWLTDETKKILAQIKTKQGQQSAFNFETFFQLSQLVCANADLDRKTAQKAFPLFKKEPWGEHHISSLYLKFIVETEKRETAVPISIMAAEGVFEEGEKWFISHLLTTWYLGVYYHDSVKEPVRVSFETSLMWDAIEDFITPPGFSKTGYGQWALHPEISERLD